MTNATVGNRKDEICLRLLTRNAANLATNIADVTILQSSIKWRMSRNCKIGVTSNARMLTRRNYGL